MNTKYSYNQLHQLYYGEQLSVAEISTMLNTSTGTIRKTLKKLGIPRRTTSEALKLAYQKGKVCPPRSGMFGCGKDNPKWKGGRRISTDGYVHVLNDKAPKGTSGTKRYISEHIVVWQQVHNRPLPKGWIIHHLNGIKGDNRPVNLKAMPNKKHDLLIPELKKRIRGLEIENRQLQRTLENGQMLFYISEA